MDVVESPRALTPSAAAHAFSKTDRVIFLALGSIGDVIPMCNAAIELAALSCSVAFATHAAHKVRCPSRYMRSVNHPLGFTTCDTSVALMWLHGCRHGCSPCCAQQALPSSNSPCHRRAPGMQLQSQQWLCQHPRQLKVRLTRTSTNV